MPILLQNLVIRHKQENDIRNAFLLNHFRFVSLLGPAGIGKTILARRTIKFFDTGDFPGGIEFMQLTSSTGNFDVNQLSDSLMKGDGAIRSRKGRHLLVVDDIDNISVEGLTLFRKAVNSDPDLCLLVTSRQQISEADATLFLRPFTQEEVEDIFKKHGLNISETSQLIHMLGGHPLAVEMVSSAILNRNFNPEELIEYLQNYETTGVILPGGISMRPTESPSHSMRIEISEINDYLLATLAKDVGLACELSSRKFEELVAELLARQGYTVELTPASKDGGKDIYIARREDLGAFLYLVECKKYSLQYPVGVELVRSLYGTVQVERATAGILVTTSTFTKGAQDFQRKVEHQLSLCDYAELHRWVCKSLKGKGHF